MTAALAGGLLIGFFDPSGEPISSTTLLQRWRRTLAFDDQRQISLQIGFVAQIGFVLQNGDRQHHSHRSTSLNCVHEADELLLGSLGPQQQT